MARSNLDSLLKAMAQMTGHTIEEVEEAIANLDSPTRTRNTPGLSPRDSQRALPPGRAMNPRRMLGSTPNFVPYDPAKSGPNWRPYDPPPAGGERTIVDARPGSNGRALPPGSDPVEARIRDLARINNRGIVHQPGPSVDYIDAEEVPRSERYRSAQARQAAAARGVGPSGDPIPQGGRNPVGPDRMLPGPGGTSPATSPGSSGWRGGLRTGGRFAMKALPVVGAGLTAIDFLTMGNDVIGGANDRALRRNAYARGEQLIGASVPHAHDRVQGDLENSRVQDLADMAEARTHAINEQAYNSQMEVLKLLGTDLVTIRQAAQPSGPSLSESMANGMGV